MEHVFCMEQVNATTRLVEGYPQRIFLKFFLDKRESVAYKPALADGANALMALMKTEEEKETQSNRKDCSRSASQ